ncbi:MAG: class I SAM-dependent methyltransferase [Vicinamibacterales bacterium]
MTVDGEAAAVDPQVLDRIFEVFRELPRGGPSDAESCRRVVALMTALPRRALAVDLGCGPGNGSTTVAAMTGARRVVAFDIHLPFVARQLVSARTSGASGGTVSGVCGDMAAAPFVAGAFDLVWSEGALYSIGFRKGLAVAASLLRKGGYLAATEAVWTVPEPPDEVRLWWESVYPDIAPVESKLSDTRAAGFEIQAHFTLPVSAWRHFYAPMRTRLALMARRWADDPVGLSVIAQMEDEIEMFDRFGGTYSYEFIVGRKE